MKFIAGLIALIFAATVVLVASSVSRFVSNRILSESKSIIIVGPTGPNGVNGANGINGETGLIGPTGPPGSSTGGMGATGIFDIEMLNVTPGTSFGNIPGPPANTIILTGMGLFSSVKAQYTVDQNGTYTASFSTLEAKGPVGTHVTIAIQVNAVDVVSSTGTSVGSIDPFATVPGIEYTSSLVAGDVISFLGTQDDGTITVSSTTTMLTVTGYV